MRFKPGDRVKRVLDDRKGEVTKAVETHFFKHGRREKETKYLVKFAPNYDEWLHDSGVKGVYNAPAPVKLEDEELCNMILIDACLKYKKFDALHDFVEDEK